jgi:hypothetical protein
MAIEKIRVGIIGASMRNGWGRDAHIPALGALPEFEITAVSTTARRPQTKRPSNDYETMVSRSPSLGRHGGRERRVTWLEGIGLPLLK